jgi:hypothetical protein
MTSFLSDASGSCGVAGSGEMERGSKAPSLRPYSGGSGRTRLRRRFDGTYAAGGHACVDPRVGGQSLFSQSGKKGQTPHQGAAHRVAQVSEVAVGVHRRRGELLVLLHLHGRPPRRRSQPAGVRPISMGNPRDRRAGGAGRRHILCPSRKSLLTQSVKQVED